MGLRPRALAGTSPCAPVRYAYPNVVPLRAAAASDVTRCVRADGWPPYLKALLFVVTVACWGTSDVLNSRLARLTTLRQVMFQVGAVRCN